MRKTKQDFQLKMKYNMEHYVSCYNGHKHLVALIKQRRQFNVLL